MPAQNWGALPGETMAGRTFEGVLLLVGAASLEQTLS